MDVIDIVISAVLTVSTFGIKGVDVIDIFNQNILLLTKCCQILLKKYFPTLTGWEETLLLEHFKTFTYFCQIINVIFPLL